MAITKAGDSQGFDYTGGMQSFKAPKKGLYKLEVYGARGGAYGPGGGYSVGYLELNENDVLYICVGGIGGDPIRNTEYGGFDSKGGYNGGGNGRVWDYVVNYGGGGATHIAKGVSAQLKDTPLANLVIVAGGGGGRCGWDYQGGSGGGLEGGNATETSHATGGTQNGGGGAVLTNEFYYGSYGQGASSYGYGAGAGGGLYGGGSRRDCSAGGGSGYIGGVPSIVYRGKTYAPSTQQGTSNTSNGYARITLEASGFPNVFFNGTQMDALQIDGIEINEIVVDGIPLE